MSHTSSYNYVMSKPDTELWYNNPRILLNNLDHFFPMQKLNRIEKVNSLARFAIYYSILIWILNKDSKWYYIPVGILLFSYLMGTNNGFSQSSEIINNNIPVVTTHKQAEQPINTNLFNPTETYGNNQPNKLIRNTIKSQINSTDNWNNFDGNKTYYSIDTFGDTNTNDWRENQNTFANWCYNDGSLKNKNQPQYITNNNTDNVPKDINIYYDADNLKKLVNNCLTFKIHLVDKNNVIL